MKSFVYIGRSRLHRNRANVIQTLHTVSALLRIGIDAVLFLPPWKLDGNIAERLEDFGIHERLDIRPSRWLHSSLFPWGLKIFIARQRRLLAAADTVYCRSFDISLALARAGVLNCFEVHDALNLVRRPEIKEYMGQVKNGKIRRLFPISTAAADILKANGVPPERLTVCPSGVDLKAFSNLTAFQKERLVKPTAIYIGRISETRGYEILRAVAKKADISVVLVGEQEDPVTNRSNLSIRSAVPHRKVPQLYEMADIVLLPYQPELRHAASISPVKLFEALASGRPIIASRLPAIQEIIEHGRDGLLVTPDDPVAWVEAIRQLRQKPDWAARMAASARQKARRYSWEERAAKLCDSLGRA